MVFSAARPAAGIDPRRRPARGPRLLPLLPLLLLAALAATGCARDDPAPGAAPPAGPGATVPVAVAAATDDADLVLPEIMEWVVEPAAAVVAAAADQHGWVNLAPRSDEAWQAVADAAAELLRTGDLLLRPGLAAGRDDWQVSATALREGALAVAAAARRHDPRGLYLAGQQVRGACQACHAQQAVPPDAPAGRP